MTPAAVLRAIADLLDSGAAQVGSVTLAAGDMPHFDPATLGVRTEPQVTATVIVTYPPGATGAPQIEGAPG